MIARSFVARAEVKRTVQHLTSRSVLAAKAPAAGGCE